jgi:crossover junction endodeoxyribonuclease RusA
VTLISVEELEQVLIWLKEWRRSVQSKDEIVLPWPPSVNRYWRSVAGRVLISQEGRAYREAVLAQMMIQRKAATHTGKLVVEIEAWRPDNRVRDLDNLLKATLDALTHAGVYKDDSQIVDLRIFWAQEKGGMLKVRIWEADSVQQFTGAKA